MARREGILDLGFLVGRRYGADSADPHMTALLCRSPTLYRGLLQASELSNKTVTNCHIGLLQPPHGEQSYFYHRPSCDADNPAIDQIRWFGLNMLIGAVRVFAGPHWQPTEIGVMTNHAPCRSIREQFPGTRIRLAQRYSYITLDNVLLSRPPLIHKVATPASWPLQAERFSNDFSGSLEQVLLSYLRESDLKIEFAADLCNMSKRTLQRKLTESGTHYSKLRDQVRFHAACGMLEDPDINVYEVGYRLGYSDSANFARAFRRIAGVTPRVYRRQHTH